MRFRRLLAISAVWAWTYALTGTFVGAWLWHHHSGLVIPIASDLIGFAVMAVLFEAMRRAPARIAPKTLLVCAYALSAANLGLLIGLGARIRHWFALVAGFSGLAIGLFWLALFVLASVLVPRKQIRTYQGLTGGLETAAGILGPLVAGWLIGHLGARTGYPVLFTAALFSTGAGLLIALSTPAPAASGAKLRAADPVPPGWPILMRGIGLLGLRDGLYLMVPSLVVYIGSQSAIRMGVFVAVEGAAQAVVFALLSGRSPHPFWSLYGGILNLAAAVLWAVRPNPITLFIFGAALSAAYPTFKVAWESWVLAAVERSGHRLPDRTRLTAAKERWLNAGRSLGLGLLAVTLVLAPRMEMLRAFLAGWSLIALYLGWLTTQRALSSPRHSQRRRDVRKHMAKAQPDRDPQHDDHQEQDQKRHH